MKCRHCGFISANNFYRCPYCGTIHKGENDVLNNSIKIGHLFSIRIRTLFILILANIFFASLFLDIYFAFQWCISYWTAIAIVGAYVLTALITGRSPIITAVEKIDIFILFALVVGSVAFKINGLFDFRRYFPTLIIPIVTIVGSLVSFVLLFVKNDKKFRPLWTEVLLISHMAIMVVIYCLYVVAKYCPTDWWLHNYFILDGNLAIVEGLLIYIALGVSVIYLINYNIVLFGHIVKEVKIQYGGEERD